MPRLLQRSRPSEPAPATSVGSDDVSLPEYEPPAFPMNDENKAKLERLVAAQRNDSDARQYEKHLNECSKNLIKAVGSINDLLFQRRRQLARHVEKRRSEGVDDKSEAERELEEYVAELEATISTLTDKSEQALRRVIDCRAEFEDTKTVLESVVVTVKAQQPRPEPKPKRERRQQRRPANDDDDDDDDDEEVEEAEDVPPVVGVIDALRTARKVKMIEYSRLSAYDKYAVHNDYIPFKRTWHDAMHPDNEIPLPDPSTWFDEDGNPVKNVADIQEDDDLVVEREIVDLKCPLSLQAFKTPFSNHKCKHTFEKDAIMSFIRSSGGKAQCPVPGCSKDLTITDLYPDEVMLRKMKRVAEASRRNADATSDVEEEEEDDDPDASIVIGRTNNIKRERNNRRVEDIEED
ncbi:hypothetical protein QC762_406970 [Podospora pseudocomata]|uniref:SP-RING-type domain-containing protein n=1 Tax=Podospora pseudocomata TaxID=2093779 RepID=A0ABR0GGU4_9PEZI|nr:hypothetical protein QC762_406970 [Podospora pseudocomata]